MSTRYNGKLKIENGKLLARRSPRDEGGKIENGKTALLCVQTRKNVG